MIGIVMNERQQKFSAVKAGLSTAASGTRAARPMVFEQIKVLSSVPNEPTITKGM